jgi:hypothetical protein
MKKKRTLSFESVCRITGVTEDLLKAKRGPQLLRDVAAMHQYVLHDLGWTYKDIAKTYGRSAHSTVISNVSRVAALISVKDLFATELYAKFCANSEDSLK